MLKDFLITAARQNAVVDIAFGVAETLSYETRMAGLCLAVAGAGLGVSAGALLTAYLTDGHWSCFAVLATSLTVTGVAGWRLYVAKQRIKALRDLLTAKALRDAASTAVEKGKELARAGLDAAGNLRNAASQLLTRKPKTDAK